MNNLEVREAIARKRLKYWEVAKALGVDPCTFSRWLRVELPEEKKQKILEAINSIE